MIVCIGDQVVELACHFCGGNYFKSSRWVVRAIQGVFGFCMHVSRSHENDVALDTGKRDFDWVARNCVKRILTKNDMEDVKAGRYFVNARRVRTPAGDK